VKAAVITCSNRSATGERADDSGELLATTLAEAGHDVVLRRIVPDDVERVDAWIHARRLKHTNRPQPGSPLDAKFSLQYVLARALVDARVGVGDFEADSHRDERVRALLPRIHVAPYDDAQFAPDNHFGGAVRLALRDGTVETARVEQAQLFGRVPGRASA
jgi:2-methylcitrate dehydratase PrpD